MSQKRKIAIAQFRILVEDCGDGTLTVSFGEFDWTILTAADGACEIVAGPAPEELPPRLTELVVLAAVQKFGQRYTYSC